MCVRLCILCGDLRTILFNPSFRLLYIYCTITPKNAVLIGVTRGEWENASEWSYPAFLAQSLQFLV